MAKGRQPGGLDAQIGLVAIDGRPIGQFAIKREASADRYGALQTWIDERARAPWVLVRVSDWWVLECSQHIHAVLGKPRREVLGRSLASLGIPELAVAPGEVQVADHWVGEHAYEVSAAGKLVADMELVHIVFRDVTERIERAESLSELAHDLTLARDHALAADRAKSAFLANMSHELRTPLNAIIGYSELLADEFEEAEARRDLDRIRASGAHLLAIVDDVLDLARIEHGLEEMPVSEVAVEPLINGVIEEMQLRALRAGITFHVRCELHTVWSNERGLRQILTNLVSNAVKFASPGVVVVGSEEGEIYVEDDGPGLDRDEQERIFEPFQQLSWTDDGVGLGLSLARRLAQAVASDLVVTSNPGRGSRFRVLFLS